jgi:energy-coupling factor transporter ATP-binding protein EcfA2
MQLPRGLTLIFHSSALMAPTRVTDGNGAMQLGEILVGRGLVTVAQVDDALAQQRRDGRRLGEHLIAAGVLTQEQLAEVLLSTPPLPRTIADTGISPTNLLNLLLKLMHVESQELVPDLVKRIGLSDQIVQELVDEAVRRRFVQTLGSVQVGYMSAIRYVLSEQGKAAAVEALAQSQYVGPCPVPLSAFQARIANQKITNELQDAGALRQALSGLVLSDRYVRKLLPAINAGRSVLLFGPPGNGKTTIAKRVAGLFHGEIYIPHAFEVGNQIVKVYDSSIHRRSMSERESASLATAAGIQMEGFDERWVAVRRPVIIVGGELTLDMLDLLYDENAKFYDAPAHIKALNGIFVIDDFGRQHVSPEALLNRWTVPMENRVDYFKLRTGERFSLPFDELVLFSTNLDPTELMDPAFLRRVPYKIKLSAPTLEEYRLIFQTTAEEHGLTLSDEVFDFVIELLTRRHAFGLAYFQPNFICDQVVQVCRSMGEVPVLTRKLAAEALANLYVQIEDEGGAS